MKYFEIFPNGCSRKQRNALRESWFKNYGNPHTEGAVWNNEIKQLDKMDSALDMLDSLFAYRPFWKTEFYRKGSAERLGAEWRISSYYDYFLAHYVKVGGQKEDFDKMLKIQFQYLQKCTVKTNVYTDYEGASYNAINEIEEIANF